MSAPKVFQRVCQDKLFPYIHFFAKAGGRSGNEPIRGYFLTFVIAVVFILIGQLPQRTTWRQVKCFFPSPFLSNR